MENGGLYIGNIRYNVGMKESKGTKKKKVSKLKYFLFFLFESAAATKALIQKS